LIWGGLRGAVCLTLALMVGMDSTLDRRLTDLTVFFAAGIVTFTLLVNGTTYRFLIIY